MKRNQVRPGITGLAQASLRSSASPEDRKRLDLEYVDGASFLYDLKILAMTVRQVLTKGGN
jgi:lipopolysaccharide/colanic/teichoic acid biosynthesis glycosyltransferase